MKLDLENKKNLMKIKKRKLKKKENPMKLRKSKFLNFKKFWTNGKLSKTKRGNLKNLNDN
jgi:hypothetical protein